MTNNEFLTLAETTFSDLLITLQKKNHDYTGANSDPFANFRLAELEGATPETGLLIRVQDKFQRIRTFLKRGTLKVDDESVYDAINDIIGYMVIFKGLVTERMHTETVEKHTTHIKEKWADPSSSNSQFQKEFENLTGDDVHEGVPC